MAHPRNLDSAMNLLGAIAFRARQLADMSIGDLRLRVESTATSPQAQKREHRHRSRGDLIEEILLEEFESAADALDEE